MKITKIAPQNEAINDTNKTLRECINRVMSSRKDDFVDTVRSACENISSDLERLSEIAEVEEAPICDSFYMLMSIFKLMSIGNIEKTRASGA